LNPHAARIQWLTEPLVFLELGHSFEFNLIFFKFRLTFNPKSAIIDS